MSSSNRTRRQAAAAPRAGSPVSSSGSHQDRTGQSIREASQQPLAPSDHSRLNAHWAEAFERMNRQSEASRRKQTTSGSAQSTQSSIGPWDHLKDRLDCVAPEAPSPPDARSRPPSTSSEFSRLNAHWAAAFERLDASRRHKQTKSGSARASSVQTTQSSIGPWDHVVERIDASRPPTIASVASRPSNIASVASGASGDHLAEVYNRKNVASGPPTIVSVASGASGDDQAEFYNRENDPVWKARAAKVAADLEERARELEAAKGKDEEPTSSISLPNFRHLFALMDGALDFELLETGRMCLSRPRPTFQARVRDYTEHESDKSVCTITTIDEQQILVTLAKVRDEVRMLYEHDNMLQIEASKLQSEFAKLTAEVQRLKSTRKRADSGVASESEASAKHARDLEQELGELRVRHDQECKKTSVLEQQIGEFQVLYDQECKKNSTLQKQASTSDKLAADHAAMQRTNTKLVAKNTALVDECEALKNYKHGYPALEHEYNKLATKHKTLAADCKSLENDCMQLDAQRQEEAERADALAKDHGYLEGANEQLFREKKTLQRENETLRSEIRTLREHAHDIGTKASNEQLFREKKTLHRENEALRSENKTFREHTHDIETKVATLRSENQTLREHVHDIETMVSTLRSENQTLQKQASTLTKVATLRSESHTLQKQASTLTTSAPARSGARATTSAASSRSGAQATTSAPVRSGVTSAAKDAVKTRVTIQRPAPLSSESHGFDDEPTIHPCQPADKNVAILFAQLSREAKEAAEQLEEISRRRAAHNPAINKRQGDALARAHERASKNFENKRMQVYRLRDTYSGLEQNGLVSDENDFDFTINSLGGI